MLQSKSLFILLCGFGVGCAPKPQFVSIDLKSIDKQLPSVSGSITYPGTSTFSEKVVIEPLPARTVLVGSGQKETQAALTLAKQNQEKAYKQALAELRKSYRAAAKAESDLEETKIRNEFELKYQNLFLELRKEFVRHALAVGPRWTRLAMLAGFPDKGKPKRLPPVADFIGRAEAAEADKLRLEIANSDQEYKSLVASKVEDLKQEFRISKTESEANRVARNYESDKKADDEAKKLMAKILDEMHESLIQDFESLPPVKGVVAQLGRQPAGYYKAPIDNGSPWTDEQRAKERALVFCKINGYVLKNPGPTVKDVTMEFQKWDQRLVGR